MRLIVEKVSEGGRVELGTIDFGPTANPIVAGFYDSAVEITAGDVIHFSVSCDTERNNMTVRANHQGQHVFTGMCHWGEVDPYFAFRLKNGTFIELYFEKDAER